MEWLQKHWSNAVTLGCIVIAAMVEAWQQAVANTPSASRLPHLQGLWNYAPLILLIIAGVAWLVGRRNKRSPLAAASMPVETQSVAPVVPGIPSLSALHGKAPQINFDAQQWFRAAYYSPMTAEIENNIKVVAHQNSPTNPEAFY